MKRVLFCLCLAATLASAGLAADFTIDAAGAPPEEAPESVRALLASDGVTVKGPEGKTVAEYWGRAEPFEGEPAKGFGIRFDTIPEGALVALVRFPEAGSDFREQEIPAGLYTLRYALHPEDGNHMGVAPSRDFAVLTPVAEDVEAAENFDFAGLVELTKKVGNPHPTVARIVLPEGDEAPHLWQDDFEHWVLDLKSADDVVGIVVRGHSEE